MFKHDYPFDPTYGYPLSDLLKVMPPPPAPGYAEFWQDTFAQAIQIDPQPIVTDSHTTINNYQTYDISFTAWPNIKLGGWLLKPTHKAPLANIIVSHGYGGRAIVEAAQHNIPANYFFYCTRGFHRSQQPDIPINNSDLHVLCNINSPETYIHRYCVADIWAAASALIQLEPDLAHNLFYTGSSFGGGMGALALPWDTRFKAACLEVPSFGNHPFRLSVPCIGSGEAVRKAHLNNPAIAQTIKFFDAASATQFITIPTHYTLALFDPAVPPPGQFSVYNGHAAPKHYSTIKGGHFIYRGIKEDYKNYAQAQNQFYCDLISGPSKQTLHPIAK
ncbi:Cephalosporin-C deacetylase [Poriferisphaera corsica]|uniref:Cephalosporin-C deacetylase n=1 Tax=Poriferisphaera corsica TaxID=2528020 RepID=A0A517YYG7_9BACT|nr:acetylxylan esterase [Poriferisphaera corsica]QDU35266.1 Cephalosporin-C deacetylase [Poriferisphaera corsica]